MHNAPHGSSEPNTICTAASALSIVAALLTINACAGEKFTTSDDSDAGGSSAGGTGSATGGGGNAASPGSGGILPETFSCPASAPVLNSPCQVPNLSCAYGDDPRPSCRPRFQCSGARWISLTNEVCTGDPTCAPSAPAPGSDCVSLYQMCAYPSSGVFCACPPCDGFCTSTRWVCSAPPAAPCPASLPNDGHACGNDGLSCTYGSCVLDDGMIADCVVGRWTWRPAC